MSGWKFATKLWALREIMVSEEGDDVEDRPTNMGQLDACDVWLGVVEGEGEGGEDGKGESREGEDEE